MATVKKTDDFFLTKFAHNEQMEINQEFKVSEMGKSYEKFYRFI